MMQSRGLVSCFLTGLKGEFAGVSALENSLTKQLSASRAQAVFLKAAVMHLPHFQPIVSIIIRRELFVLDLLTDFSGVY